MTETLTDILLITAVINLFLIAVLTLAVIARITGRRLPPVTPRGGARKGGKKGGVGTTDSSANRTKAGTISE